MDGLFSRTGPPLMASRLRTARRSYCAPIERPPRGGVIVISVTGIVSILWGIDKNNEQNEDIDLDLGYLLKCIFNFLQSFSTRHQAIRDHPFLVGTQNFYG